MLDNWQAEKILRAVKTNFPATLTGWTNSLEKRKPSLFGGPRRRGDRSPGPGRAGAARRCG